MRAAYMCAACNGPPAGAALSKSSPLLAVPTQWAVALANAHEAHFFYPAGLRQSESARSTARGPLNVTRSEAA